MPFQIHKQLEVQISQILAILELNEELRNQVAAGAVQTTNLVDDQYWRRYDYCAALIRLYATFERFIIDLTQRWLDWLIANQFTLLAKSEKAVERYRLGTAEILRRTTEVRFAKIDLISLVNGLAALQNAKPFTLGTDALFSNTSNIRLNDVISVLEAIEIPETRAWISAYQPLADHCDVQQISTESFLKELVDRRNEAAHGNKLPDDVWSVSVMKDAGTFVLKLTAAITELIAARMAETGSAASVERLGAVSEVFVQAKAVVVTAAGGGVWVGMPVLVVSKSTAYLDSVSSIRINDVPTAAWLPQEGMELGLRLGRLPPRSSQLYFVKGLA